MNDRNAFDRQLEREIDHLAGPDPIMDVSEIVGRAARPTPRWHLPAPLRMAQVAVAIAVVALFAGFLGMSGILDPTEDPAVVGASPSAGVDATPSATSDPESAALPAVKISFASGSFEAIDDGDIDMDEEIEAAIALTDSLLVQDDDVWVTGPARFLVTSTDPRLSGEAFALAIEGAWAHEVTVDDIDVVDPDGPWRISSHQGRLEITNADGTWSGTSGPAFWAEGTEPSDGVPNNAATSERVGPIVLTGSGAYAGLTAFIDGGTGWVLEDQDFTSFEAVIVNRQLPGGPSDQLWFEALRAQEGRE